MQPPVRTAGLALTLALAVALPGCRSDAAPGGDGTEGTAGGSSVGESATTTTSSSSGLGADASSSADWDEGSTTEPLIPIDCTESCIDVASNAGIALCYSCRCKAAFDNWLPGPDEVQCSEATPIISYHADLSGPEIVLAPSLPDATDCANPSLLTGSCRQGSKLGQLQHGDVMLRWICRDPYLDLNGEVLYEDMGLVGQNVRTGVTCFWDDIDDVTHDDDMPPLDLMEASDQERARHQEVFYFTDGDSCKECHDHDPFIYTPYLQSTDWITVAAAKSPYSLVNLNGTGRATGNFHLVSPQANACLACHRIGSQNTCESFVRDSLGLNKDAPYEQQVRDAAQPGSPHWKLAYWMPTVAAPVADFATWVGLFGVARDHILACCAAPGRDIGDCLWEPVPAEG